RPASAWPPSAWSRLEQVGALTRAPRAGSIPGRAVGRPGVPMITCERDSRREPAPPASPTCHVMPREGDHDMPDRGQSYTSGTSDLPLLGRTIGDMFDEIAERYPDHEALVSRHQGLRYTYGQLRAEVDRCARALIALGVTKGQRLGIWAPNCAEWAI